MIDEVNLGISRELYKGKYRRKFNRVTGNQGNNVTRGRRGCNWRRAGQKQCSAKKVSIQDMPGKCSENMSAVHIYIVAARCSL
jgi:hypothetical protein